MIFIKFAKREYLEQLSNQGGFGVQPHYKK